MPKNGVLRVSLKKKQGESKELGLETENSKRVVRKTGPLRKEKRTGEVNGWGNCITTTRNQFELIDTAAMDRIQPSPRRMHIFIMSDKTISPDVVLETYVGRPMHKRCRGSRQHQHQPVATGRSAEKKAKKAAKK